MTSDREPIIGRGRAVGSVRWVPVCLAVLLGTMTVLWLPRSPVGRVADTQEWLGALSALAALNGIVLLSAALVLSTRLCFVESAAGGLDRQYRAHHWVGGWGLVLIALHPTLLAWRYAQVSWRRAAQLWWPSSQDMSVVAGQVAFYGMAVAVAVTLYAHVRYQVLVWLQRLLGLLFLPAAYHALYAGGGATMDPALRWYLRGLLAVGVAALLVDSVLGRFVVRRHRFRVAAVRELAGGVTELLLDPAGRPMSFLPGQFGYLRFAHQRVGGEQHPFSMASAPGSARVRFAIKDLGDYTHHIGEVAVGAEAEVEGPYGRFSYRFVRGRRQVWIAGGVGIAPFVAMAEALPAAGYDVDLYYGFPDTDHAPYLELLGGLADQRLRLHPVEESGSGFVTAARIAADVGALAGREFLICGPPAMVHGLREQLRAHGVPRGRIHFEELAFP